MPTYRGARALIDASAKQATQQKNANIIGNKSSTVRKAAKNAKSAAEQLSTGILESLDLDEMALLERINGELPNRNIATLEDATKIGDGVVAARTLISQDSAAFNLWAQNAMIQSAKIANLAVDKLTAGSFTAGDIVLASGGAIKAGSITFDSTGITLGQGTSWQEASAQRDTKITDPNNKHAIGFWKNDSLNQRGIGIRAEGAGQTSSGAILLNALANSGQDEFGAWSSWLHILARKDDGTIQDAQIYMGTRKLLMYAGTYAVLESPSTTVTGSLICQAGIRIDGALNPNGGIDPHRYAEGQSLAGGGGWYQWAHGAGVTSVHCQFQVSTGAGVWKPIEFVSGIYVDYVDATHVRVKNDTGSAKTVRGWIHKIVDI